MKENIRIHILPTYKVDVETCFTKYSSSDKTVGDLVKYDNLLSDLEKQYTISQISISGGEITELSDLYFDLLYKIVKLHSDNISVYTNFVHFNKALINGADVINVEYNFDADEKYKKQIFSNIKAAVQINKIINLKTIDLACDIEPVKAINTLNKLNIKTWEIIPYQATEYTNLEYEGHEFFEKTIMKFINYSYQMNFAFYNKLQLEGIIPLNNYEIKTIYLTPNNKYALPIYKNKIMSLEEYDNLSDLNDALSNVKKQQEKYCKDCNVKLKCLANYYQDFKDNEVSCCGFSNLISKYHKEKETK